MPFEPLLARLTRDLGGKTVVLILPASVVRGILDNFSNYSNFGVLTWFSYKIYIFCICTLISIPPTVLFFFKTYLQLSWPVCYLHSKSILNILSLRIQYCIIINNIGFWHGVFCFWKVFRNIFCLDSRYTYFAGSVAGVFLNHFFKEKTYV